MFIHKPEVTGWHFCGTITSTGHGKHQNVLLWPQLHCKMWILQSCLITDVKFSIPFLWWNFISMKKCEICNSISMEKCEICNSIFMTKCGMCDSIFMEKCGICDSICLEKCGIFNSISMTKCEICDSIGIRFLIHTNVKPYHVTTHQFQV